VVECGFRRRVTNDGLICVRRAGVVHGGPSRCAAASRADWLRSNPAIRSSCATAFAELSEEVVVDEYPVQEATFLSQETLTNAPAAVLRLPAPHSCRMTLAFLIPPKLRSKRRFLSIGKLAPWGEKMLGVLAVKGRASKGSPLAKLRAALPGFLRLRAFVATFAATAVTVSQVMEILKHQGLHRSTYKQCCQLAEQLPAHTMGKHHLHAWLSRHIDILSQLVSEPKPQNTGRKPFEEQGFQTAQRLARGQNGLIGRRAESRIL